MSVFIKFVKWYYRLSNLEAIVISTAVLNKEWSDFRHTLLDKIILSGIVCVTRHGLN